MLENFKHETFFDRYLKANGKVPKYFLLNQWNLPPIFEYLKYFKKVKETFFYFYTSVQDSTILKKN